MCSVARDGEADSLRGQNDCGIHADDFARAVQKRTAGIPGVQRRIGLDDLVHQTARLRPHRAPKRTNNSSGYSLLKTIGRTDRNRDLANPNPRRVGETGMLKVRRVDSNYRQVSLRIGPNEPGRKDARVVQRYLKLARTMDHVAVGQNKSISGNNESRATAGTAFTTEDANIHHRRCDPVYDGGDRLGDRKSTRLNSS